MLTWELGSIESGGEMTLSMELLPRTEGEIGSVAQVGFQTQVSVRTRCTRPLLTIEQTAPDRVLIGEEIVFAITIANPGSGAARGVVLEADIPEELTHELGGALKNEIGTIAPGDELRYELKLRAQRGGIVTNTVRVLGGDNLMDDHSMQVEVIAPRLQVGVRGATRRYLQRQVTYEVTVTNPGTAPAKNVDLITYLPKGLKFESADNKGRYDAPSHAVAWNLEQLPEQETGIVRLTAVPMEIGEQQLVVRGKADLDLSAETTHTTKVEGTVELTFTIADIQDPIEVGSETTYEIHVINQGSKVATNVQLMAELPRALTPSEPSGATRGEVQGQRVVMEKIARLAPQADAVYRIKATGQIAGDHLINVQLTSDDVPRPVTKQEGTKVYADRE